jgi:acyl-CoA reductase-like NAD-dependent aldehyde dehydrogenase
MTMTATIRHPESLYIGGKWVAPAGSGMIDVTNSATEELFARVAEAGKEDVQRAVAAARDAFDYGPWPRMTPQERAGYLKALAAELDAHADETALALSCETGMVFAMAKMMSRMPAGIYAKHADYADSFAFEEKRQPNQSGAAGALLVREPVGVVAAIVPWNGPATGIAQKVAPALICGCSVIVKVSPEAPTAAYTLAEACEKIGLPQGVVNILTADRDASESLVRHADVDMVAFTGSTATGKRIASICGERIARYQLELGGKSPAIIFDDFDLGQAAQILSGAARFLTGQVCAALTRCIVTAARHDAFVDALVACFGATKVGDPFDATVQMGPLAMRRQRERVEGYIAKGKAQGARLVTGGGRPAHLDRGWFVEPTVFANVDNNSTIGREEIFGPVLCVIAAKNEADAVRIANETHYGLNATVFTHDVERAYAVARTLRSGTVGHNAPRVDLSIGFGGFKQSGIGREGGGVDGLAAFVERKTVLLGAYPKHLAD